MACFCAKTRCKSCMKSGLASVGGGGAALPALSRLCGVGGLGFGATAGGGAPVDPERR